MIDFAVSGVERARLVLHAPHEAAPAPHHEPAVPVVGQQQLEVDLGLDDPRHPAVRREVRIGPMLGRAYPHVDELQRRQIGAGVGEIRGGGRARGISGQAGGDRTVHEATLDAGHRRMSAAADSRLSHGSLPLVHRLHKARPVPRWPDRRARCPSSRLRNLNTPRGRGRDANERYRAQRRTNRSNPSCDSRRTGAALISAIDRNR